MKLEKVTEQNQLIEGEQYLVRLWILGDLTWSVMYAKDGVLTEHPDGGDLKLTLEMDHLKDNIFILPYKWD
jgi:hypothetical protein